MLWWEGVNSSSLKHFHGCSHAKGIECFNGKCSPQVWVTALPLWLRGLGRALHSYQCIVRKEMAMKGPTALFKVKNQSSSKDPQAHGLLWLPLGVCVPPVSPGLWHCPPGWATSLQGICGSWQHRVSCCAPHLCFRNVHLSQVTNTHLSFSVFYQLFEICFKTNLSLLLAHSPPSLLLSPHSPILSAQSAAPNLLLLLSVAKPTFNFFLFFSPFLPF